jgi:hypothetical protein
MKSEANHLTQGIQPLVMNSPKQVSHRHHYVPQFYLRTWQDPERGKFWLYTRNAVNRITYRHQPAKSVGYLHDLYSLKPNVPWTVFNPVSDILETNFFSLVDDAAAIVHQKLVSSGLSALSGQDRLDWALFLNSLMERNPKRISEIKNSFSIDEVKKEFTTHWGRSGLLDKIDVDAIHHNSLLHALVTYITDEAFVSYVANMRWATIDIPIDGEHLLTSDMPLLINGGVAGNPIHLLSIALSPKRLLIMHSDDEGFDEDFIRTLTVIHNISIVENTQQYLISSRELKDGPFTRFSRVVEEKLKVRHSQNI